MGVYALPATMTLFLLCLVLLLAPASSSLLAGHAQTRQLQSGQAEAPAPAPPVCEIRQCISDVALVRQIDQRCPCDGRWTTRRAYMKDCVEPQLNEWRDEGCLEGSKAKLFWFAYFSHMYFLPRGCGICGPDCPESARHDA